MHDDPIIDSRVARLMKSWGNLEEASCIAYDLGFWYLSWVYLMEQEVRRPEVPGD